MAELRLAMLGMGKAMSGYISALPPLSSEAAEGAKDAWKGLDKVRNALSEAGAGDVEDLVKEWAWHDGL